MHLRLLEIMGLVTAGIEIGDGILNWFALAESFHSVDPSSLSAVALSVMFQNVLKISFRPNHQAYTE